MAVAEAAGPEPAERDLVGPVIRSGPLAEAVIDAVTDDNAGQEVIVVDRGDYVRVHTARRCRLSRASLERYLGRPVTLAELEIEMPSFAGRLRTRVEEYPWFYDRNDDDG
jgi:hypothetical protein